MNYRALLKSFTTTNLLPFQAPKKNHQAVNITRDLKSVVVRHKNHNMLIKRVSDNDARIPEMFTKASRPCPPFCVQPMQSAPGVETIGELEMLDYLSASTSESKDYLIVDSRMEEWVRKGTIPGAVNIPWTDLSASQGATTKGIMAILKHYFKVSFAENLLAAEVDTTLLDGSAEKFFDYTTAKTLVLFCNGTWCGQTSESIKSLISFGYPADKIKYFRNGMQGWVTLGLTTVSAEDEETTECKLK